MDVLVSLEFNVGVFSQCLARRRSRFILLVYHGDDFVVLGGQVDLMWFYDSLSRHMTVKMRGIMSLDSGNFIKEIRLLNRIITIGFDESCGLPYLDWEADSRHCEILWQQLGLSRSKSVTTPGVKRTAL